MPDWCINELAVSGPPATVTAFCSRVAGFPQLAGESLLRGSLVDSSSARLSESLRTRINECLVGGFDFENTHPTPRELLDSSAPFRGSATQRERLMGLYGAVDWYSWQVLNWGVKWGPRNVSTSVSSVGVEISFWTPWGPPLVWADKIAREHPGLLLSLGWCTEDDTRDSAYFAYYTETPTPRHPNTC